MPIDISEALVTITLEGLFVVCQNDRSRPKRWEIGVLNIPDSHPVPHSFSIRVFRNSGNGKPKDITDTFKPAPGHAIEIITEPAGELAPEYFPLSGPFDPADPQDHRWIIDLEGGRFHNGVVEARPDIPKTGLLSHYKQKIYVEGGALYTVAKTIEEYKRVRNASDVLQLGKVALALGLHLRRASIDTVIDAVVIRNSGPNPTPIRLERVPGVRYEVVLKHVCDNCDKDDQTDFNLYYEVLRARDLTRFRLLSKDAPLPALLANGEEDPSALIGGRGADEPQICNAVLLGQTVSLPGI